jgi:ferredoxin
VTGVTENIYPYYHNEDVALSITDECTCCAACLTVCPNQAIFEMDPSYRIDAWLCTECLGFADEPTCLEVCPAPGAIVPVQLLAVH